MHSMLMNIKTILNASSKLASCKNCRTDVRALFKWQWIDLYGGIIYAGPSH
jgi:hypothetical protein